MSKLVNYKCENCETEFEELFGDTEEIPEELVDTVCPDCQGKFKIWNFKNNKQVWKYMS